MKSIRAIKIITVYIETKIDKALDAYGKAYLLLWEQVQENPNEFPSCAISSGTIAEYYAKKYLEEKYKGHKITFGRATEKAWDIKVSNDKNEEILFQVKSTSLFNKTRRLSSLTKGFDQLIVISLDCDFFPFQAFLFEDSTVFFGDNKITTLTVPNPDSNRTTGSTIFSAAKNIHEEFFENLANRL